MESNWQEIVIAPTAPLREALGVIDAGALRLALVVGEGMCCSAPFRMATSAAP